MAADDTYRQQLFDALRECGAQILEHVSVSDQLRNINPAMQFQVVRHSSGQRLLLSLGCAASVHANTIKTEFLIALDGEGAFERRILEYVAYFHLTHSHINFAECRQIGSYEDGPFSHVFMSVPYFFPGAVNFINVENYRYAIIWLMPIKPEEAAFIDKFGTDAFEARLKYSGYDYFDERTDLSYLTSPQ